MRSIVDNIFDLLLILTEKMQIPSQQQSPENHFILSQRPCFVAQNITDPSQLFRNIAVSALTTRQQFIIVNLVLV